MDHRKITAVLIAVIFIFTVIPVSAAGDAGQYKQNSKKAAGLQIRSAAHGRFDIFCDAARII